MSHLDQLRAALDPFGMNMNVDVHVDPPGGCTATKTEEDLKSEAELKKQQEEAASNHLNHVEEAMKNLGKHFEAHYGVKDTAQTQAEESLSKQQNEAKAANETTESNVRIVPISKEPEQPVEVKEPKEDTLETMTENLNLSEAQKDEAMKELGKKPKERQDPEDWTVLDKAPTPEPSPKGGAEALYPELEDKKEDPPLQLPPKVQVALQAMENMGFNNQGGWLSTLLIKHDGDIGKVLDLLSPAKPFRT